MKGAIHFLSDCAGRLAWPVRPGAFRLFLAMLVFVHHFSSLDWGPYAVYVFFVLSGFWVQTMWEDRYCRTRQPYLTYMVSRAWRLAPVMVLVSLITVALLPVIGIPASQVFASNPLHLAFSSTFLLGYSRLDYAPVGSAWSLDVEMQYYLLAPLFALLAARLRSGVLMIAAAAISAASAVWTAHDYHVGKYLLFFFAGLIAARHDWQPGKRLAHASAIVVVALVIAVLVSPWRGILIGGANPGPLHVHAPAFNVAMGLLSIPFALYTVRQESDATDRMMADLSYIIYLLHWVAMQWFFQFTQPFTTRLAVAATSFAVVPGASWLIWRFYDKPINRLRAQWVARRMVR
ncbi:MAG: acyltransferase family protein [Novosphingobium sp.]